MTEYEKLTVVKLREELVKRGLPKTGNKAVLVQRLNEADEQPAKVETTTSDVEATLAEDNNANEVTATPPVNAGEQQPGYPAIISNGADSTNLAAQSTATRRIDGPSAVAPDTDQEAPHKQATTKEERNPPEDGYTTQIEEAEVQPNEGKPTKTVHTTAADDGGIPTEKQEITGIAEIPAETADPLVPSAEEETPAVSRSESATGEEMMKDIRKRKRRSLTPTPSDESIQKKAKIGDGGFNVKLPEDESMGDADAPPIPDATPVESAEAEKPNSIEDTAMENAPPLVEAEAEDETVQTVEPAVAEPAPEDTGTDIRTPPAAPETTARQKTPEIGQSQANSEPSKAPPESPAKTSSPDARFKNLRPSSSRKESSPVRQGLERKTDDRVVTPALHPATTALYIRDILRPLHVENLKEHLITLATPSNSSPDPGVIADFFLDSIRTHCLVRFETVAAASRVRSGLHERVWPDEKNRKPLWVDFVPEEKLRQWMEVENASSGRGQSAKRYEVVYENEEDGVKAYLQLVGSNNNVGPRNSQVSDSRKESGAGVHGAPLGPGFREGEHGEAQQPKGYPDQGRGFQALDDLFQSTVAKPKIYYLPVPKRTAEKRLDQLAEGRGGGRDEGIHREEDAVLIEATRIGEVTGGTIEEITEEVIEEVEATIDRIIEETGAERLVIFQRRCGILEPREGWALDQLGYKMASLE
ncbi:MAG: hypothetical protein Q9226_001219 [Calogaya cf. arnoldii]